MGLERSLLTLSLVLSCTCLLSSSLFVTAVHADSESHHQAEKSIGSRIKWWHAVLGIGTIVCLFLFLTLACPHINCCQEDENQQYLSFGRDRNQSSRTKHTPLVKEGSYPSYSDESVGGDSGVSSTFGSSPRNPVSLESRNNSPGKSLPDLNIYDSGFPELQSNSVHNDRRAAVTTLIKPGDPSLKRKIPVNMAALNFNSSPSASPIPSEKLDHSTHSASVEQVFVPDMLNSSCADASAEPMTPTQCARVSVPEQYHTLTRNNSSKKRLSIPKDLLHEFEGGSGK